MGEVEVPIKKKLLLRKDDKLFHKRAAAVIAIKSPFTFCLFVMLLYCFKSLLCSVLFSGTFKRRIWSAYLRLHHAPEPETYFSQKSKFGG